MSPILDVDDEAKGYLGTIGEHNVLVQMTPQLQIKNIEEISKIKIFYIMQLSLFYREEPSEIIIRNDLIKRKEENIFRQFFNIFPIKNAQDKYLNFH